MRTIELPWTKAKRYARLWWQDVVAQSIAPLTDNSARLNYIAVLVLALVLAPRWGSDRQLDAAVSMAENAEAILWSVPLFAGLNMVFAIFRVRKEEKARGDWFGVRFVYHQPLRLLTVLVNETNNGKPFRFSVPDAEDGSFIFYMIETDRSDHRAKVEIAWESGQRPMDAGVAMNLPKGGIRMGRGRAFSLLTHLEPQSTMTTVRVFMTAWEVGKGGRL